MATDKKSVLLYCDILHTVKELSDEEAGQLFKHYLEYINDLNPEPPSKLIKIVFEPIKQNLKRDLKKWETKSLKNSEIAKERWNKRTDANGCERIKSDANHADKDKVIVKVKDKVIVKDINNRDFVDLLFLQTFEDWMNYKKTRKESYKSVESEKAFYNKLLKLSNNNPVTAKSIIEQSMANNWAGIFELKETKKENVNMVNGTVNAYNEVLNMINRGEI